MSKQPTPKQIIEALAEAIAKCDHAWELPWRKGTIPISAFTTSKQNKDPYELQGQNPWLCAYFNHVNGFTSLEFNTLKQWNLKGYRVKREQFGNPCYILQPKKFKKTMDDGTERWIMTGFRTIREYNAEQVENYDPSILMDKLKAELKQHEPVAHDKIDAMVKALNVELVHNEQRAYYQPSTDRINMPTHGSFKDSKGYYSTLLHELVHWTGHKTRLDRLDLKNKHGYAFEELVAELGSMKLSHHFKINLNPMTDDQHLAYLKSWSKGMKDSEKYLLTASKQAEKAVDWLIGSTLGA